MRTCVEGSRVSEKANMISPPLRSSMGNLSHMNCINVKFPNMLYSELKSMSILSLVPCSGSIVSVSILSLCTASGSGQC